MPREPKSDPDSGGYVLRDFGENDEDLILETAEPGSTEVTAVVTGQREQTRRRPTPEEQAAEQTFLELCRATAAALFH